MRMLCAVRFASASALVLVFLLAAGCSGAGGGAPPGDSGSGDDSGLADEAGGEPDAASTDEGNPADDGEITDDGEVEPDGADSGPDGADQGPPVCDPAAAGTGLPTLAAPDFSVTVSAPRPIFRSMTDKGIQYYPDSAVTFRQTLTGWEVYIPAGRETYRLAGGTPASLTLGAATPVLAPTGNTQDPHQGYAGISSVIQCGGALTGFFHAEYHAIPVEPWAECPVPYHASMARATSVNGGVSFGVAAPAWFLNSAGKASYSAGKCAYGAGGGGIFDPGGEYLYLYYYDWDAPNGIYLARACREGCGKPGTWKKYHAGAFASEAFAADFLQPSGPATPLLAAAGASFDAFPVVSHNSYLDAYLMVVATEAGFALRVSADGLAWGPRVILLEHLEAQDARLPVYYPTVVDASTWSRQATGRKLRLVYAAGVDDLGQRAPHRAFVADLELTRAGDTPTASDHRRVLARYSRSKDPTDHWITTAPVEGYDFEGNLGRLAANSEAGTRPLYDCLLGGTDHTVSGRSDCEGGTSLGIMGCLWPAAAADRRAIYRCIQPLGGGAVDHFVSIDPACEKLTVEGLLGYAEL